MASIESRSGLLRVTILPGGLDHTLRAGRFLVEVRVDDKVVFSKVYRSVKYAGDHYDVMNVARACMHIEEMLDVTFPFSILSYSSIESNWNEPARLGTGPYWCRVELCADTLRSSGRRHVYLGFTPVANSIKIHGERIGYVEHSYGMYTTVEATRNFGLALLRECYATPAVQRLVELNLVLPFTSDVEIE